MHEITINDYLMILGWATAGLFWILYATQRRTMDETFRTLRETEAYLREAQTQAIKAQDENAGREQAIKDWIRNAEAKFRPSRDQVINQVHSPDEWSKKDRP